jgi:hypothetical protein
MEIIEPKRKYSYQKKKLKKCPNSAKKVRDSPILFLGKDINDEKPQEGTNHVRKRKSKFNSIDGPNFMTKKIRFNDHPPALVSPRKHKKKIPNKENHITEYLDNLYKDEPHFRKSVIRKKTTKVNIKGFRKVSFLNPKEKKNSKQNVNILNINKSSISIKDEDDKNKSKSRIFNNNDIYGEQVYGYDKKYMANLIKDDEMTLKSVIISDNNLFNSRNLKRKQTSKTNKSAKKILNILKFKGYEKRNSSKSNNISTKRQISSKSNDKKSKKKENKAIKVKDKEKKNNNNFEEDDDNKIKIEKSKKKNNKKENEDENTHSKSKKHKNNQELTPNKEIENIDTVIQIDTQNKKKKKKQFCCYPFLVCLKFENNEDNDNVL